MKTMYGVVALFLLALPALAQDPDSIKAAVGAPKPSYSGRLAGDMNFGQIGEDWFTTVNLGFNLDLGQIGFGIQVPLRLRVYDNDPKSDEDIGGIIRKEDWDQFSDFLKIIRFFRFGHKGDLVFLQVGDLPGAILGHGTIVNRYYNNIDIDHYRMGLQVDVNTDYGGAETLINSLSFPNLFGVRGYVKPWSFVDTEAYLNNLAVGVSVASDLTAPFELEKDPVSGTPVIGEDGYLKVSRESATTVIGGDLEFKVLNTELLTLTPYMDLNHILDAGTGYHAGVLSTFHFPIISMDLQARLEYRYFFGGDYVPAYFDSYYEIQKFGFPFRNALTNADEVEPKRRALELLGDKGLNGYFAELNFNFMGLFSIGGSYDDYDGPFNSNLRLYLDVPALEVFQFGAYYYKHNFEGAKEAFTFDDKSLFLVEGRYQLNSFLYLVAQYWRIWQLDADTTSNEFGQYVAVDDWSIGLGMSYTF